MINVNKYYIEKPIATVIMVHGIAEHSGRYDTLAKRFNEEGYDVVTYDHIGHGKSLGKRGKLRSYRDNIDVLHKIVTYEKARSINKVFILGHSMGGAVVNFYGVTFQDVDGIISVAAASQTPNSSKALKYTGFWYLRWLRINTKMFDKGLAKDPYVLKKNKQDPLMLKYIYVSLIGEMFIKGVKYFNENIDKFKTPVLYLHGTADTIVQHEASIETYSKIDIEDKEIILYDDEYHEMLNDYNREKVITDILNWLDRHVN